MPRIRVSSPTTVTGGSSGGGGGSPTTIYDDDLRLVDAYRFGSTRNDPLRLIDAARLGSTRNDPVRLVDAYRITATASRNDLLRLDDAGRYQLTDLIVGRSGTPDTDQMSDAWVDQAATGVNHGNESLLVKGKTTVGSDERASYLQVDLTRVTGHSAGTAGGSLAYIASTSSILTATTLNVTFAVQAARWFTESTVTWATGPVQTPTSLANQSIATGAAATYTTTFTQAQLSTMLGNWVLFTFRSPTGALTDTITILSRDNATASNRPKFSAALTIT